MSKCVLFSVPGRFGATHKNIFQYKMAQLNQQSELIQSPKSFIGSAADFSQLTQTCLMVLSLHCRTCNSWLIGGLPSSPRGVLGLPSASRKKANKLEYIR